ncbi:GTP-Rho binding exocyst subunit [Chamberlinius hualienensis]
MAAIRHAISREVYQPNYETLVGFVHVTMVSKKKKSCFLCVGISNEKPFSVTISQIKKGDKDIYKKKRSWNLRELKLLDGKNSKDTAEFDLQFDRVYKWIASSAQDRNVFINCLRKLWTKYISRTKHNFINIPNEILEDVTLGGNTDMRAIGEDSIIEPEEYQALTEREETDLIKILSESETSISNAEAFTEQLSKDLSILDGANIHTIMASEENVQRLMDLIQHAIDEASFIENTLEKYDEILKNVRETIVKIEDKNLLIQVQNSNMLKLYSELDKIVKDLELSHAHQMTLLDRDLTKSDNVIECTVAAQALQKSMEAKLHPCLLKMSAVVEQQKLFEKLRGKFTNRLSRHLNNLFIHLGNEMGETAVFHNAEPVLPHHRSCHKDLMPYADLMLWLKTTDNNVYMQLSKVYTDSLSKQYNRELQEFFENSRQQFLLRLEKERRGRGTGSNQDLTTKATGKVKSSLLGVDREVFGSELDMADRTKFDKLIEKILSGLEPVCVEEQQFCVKFFHLATDSGQKETGTQLTVPGAGNLIRSASEEMLLTSQKKEKQINDELRTIMGRLFSVLETELNNFISFFDKMDSFYSMYLLVRLSQHVMSTQDTGSFISMTFANCLVQVKRNFDKFMAAQIKSIEDAKVSKKSKCGILPFVLNFEEFAQQAGAIFQGSERRNYLDKWYVKLVAAMFDAITRIASEQTKTPKEVVMMENFHHLFALLSQLKIACLDAVRREAKQKYNEYLHAYVTEYFGRPLEKLNTFFEGVKAKVQQGVKQEEIGYQLAFSKQELRKVIKEYPGKEVKRGLENLYRKVEKHLSEEEYQLQVVWHSMQEEFIGQHKEIQNLIELCYPGSMITLEFSIDDILRFFSDIAQSH